jgi:hypothetical protein
MAAPMWDAVFIVTPLIESGLVGQIAGRPWLLSPTLLSDLPLTRQFSVVGVALFRIADRLLCRHLRLLIAAMFLFGSPAGFLDLVRH